MVLRVYAVLWHRRLACGSTGGTPVPQRRGYLVNPQDEV